MQSLSSQARRSSRERSLFNSLASQSQPPRRPSLLPARTDLVARATAVVLLDVDVAADVVVEVVLDVEDVL